MIPTICNFFLLMNCLTSSSLKVASPYLSISPFLQFHIPKLYPPFLFPFTTLHNLLFVKPQHDHDEQGGGPVDRVTGGDGELSYHREVEVRPDDDPVQCPYSLADILNLSLVVSPQHGQVVQGSGPLELLVGGSPVG